MNLRQLLQEHNIEMTLLWFDKIGDVVVFKYTPSLYDKLSEELLNKEVMLNTLDDEDAEFREVWLYD